MVRYHGDAPRNYGECAWGAAMLCTQRVSGSNPSGSTNQRSSDQIRFNAQGECAALLMQIESGSIPLAGASTNGGVAQSGRAAGFDPVSRWFKSIRPCQSNSGSCSSVGEQPAHNRRVTCSKHVRNTRSSTAGRGFGSISQTSDKHALRISWINSIAAATKPNRNARTL